MSEKVKGVSVLVIRSDMDHNRYSLWNDIIKPISLFIKDNALKEFLGSKMDIDICSIFSTQCLVNYFKPKGYGVC